MDASHLILGRPWQFDNKAMYDGRKTPMMFIEKTRRSHFCPSAYQAETNLQENKPTSLNLQEFFTII